MLYFIVFSGYINNCLLLLLMIAVQGTKTAMLETAEVPAL
jgi:hypothetical protein